MSMGSVSRIAAALAMLAVCTASAAPRLIVFAAADLAFAFKEIVPLFERATGSTVTLVTGSTGNFAHQIDAGAPADVFFAANAEYVDALAAKDRVIPSTRTLYAQGRIVLATPRQQGSTLTGLEHLTDPKIRKIAIANPQHAPYGKAAEEALRAVGIWDAVKPKLVYGENIRHALQFLQTGAVDAGIVALSVADVPEITFVLIDMKLHAPLNQVAAVVRRSQVPDLAQAFIKFVTGPEGRPIMKRYGFVVPGEL
jgi:molybdate transport system substrate-binding protein